MSEQILTTTVQAPGFMGLNLQDSSVSLENGYATVATNCVIDKFGRIGARQGWSPAHTALAGLTGYDVKCISELIDNTGNSYIVAAGHNKLFKLVGTTLTELTYGGGGTAPTITDDNWQMAPLNGCLYIYQDGHTPLVFDPAVSTTTYKRISEKSGYVGTVQSNNCVISAYGRTWSANSSSLKSTVQFSDLLAGHVLNTGTSGTLDVSQVWPAGADEITALAAHNNFLIIFGRRQILIYANATDPNNLTLSDSITGAGCFARDSVVKTGSDVVFLSDTGVKSLMRTIQEKSAPMRELSLNVKDSLIKDLEFETASNIKAVYSDKNAFYLLSLPTPNAVYCFDMRGQLQNGAAKTTIWDNITPTAFFYTRNKDLLLGKLGYIGKYQNYLDNTATYKLKYYTNYFDFGSPTSLKILKKVNLTFIGGNGADVVVKYGFDFSPSYSSRIVELGGVSISEYGVAEYNIAQYTAGVVYDNKKIDASGSGNTLQIGIETDVDDFEISLQKLDCYVKTGRTR
jgi:hypothetical protein